MQQVQFVQCLQEGIYAVIAHCGSCYYAVTRWGLAQHNTKSSDVAADEIVLFG